MNHHVKLKSLIPMFCLLCFPADRKEAKDHKSDDGDKVSVGSGSYWTDSEEKPLIGAPESPSMEEPDSPVMVFGDKDSEIAHLSAEKAKLEAHVRRLQEQVARMHKQAEGIQRQKDVL